MIKKKSSSNSLQSKGATPESYFSNIYDKFNLGYEVKKNVNISDK